MVHEYFNFSDASNDNPLSDQSLRNLLRIKDITLSTLDITETDTIECKLSLDVPDKTVAAFANNRGGYILCGVEDKNWRIIGLDDTKLSKFAKLDLRNLNQRTLSCYGTDLGIRKRLFEILGKTIGVFYIPVAQNKPVICIKNSGSHKQGHIYYRYPGEDRLITPTDLQKIIEERISQLSKTLALSQIERLLKVGLSNAAIMDTTTGEVEGTGGKFVIDETLLPKLKLIKEGEFNEKSGSPTLKLVGQVVPVEKSQIVHAVKKENLIDSYPLTATELADRVIERCPQVGRNRIWAFITDHEMRGNFKYSAYNFRSKKHEDMHKAGVAKSLPQSIYNEDAVEFICDNIISK